MSTATTIAKLVAYPYGKMSRQNKNEIVNVEGNEDTRKNPEYNQRMNATYTVVFPASSYVAK